MCLGDRVGRRAAPLKINPPVAKIPAPTNMIGANLAPRSVRPQRSRR